MPTPGDVVLDATRVMTAIAAKSIASVADDITLPQYRVLVVLDTRGKQTMTELAAELEVTPSTATRVCDRLTARKLIKRLASPTDRRVVCVDLTASGRRLIEGVLAARRRHIDLIIGAMTRDARDRLAGALENFVAAAETVEHSPFSLARSNEVVPSG